LWDAKTPPYDLLIRARSRLLARMQLFPLLEQMCFVFLVGRIRHNAIIEGTQIDALGVLGDADAFRALLWIDYIS
jgi:hypothetical protein